MKDVIGLSFTVQTGQNSGINVSAIFADESTMSPEPISQEHAMFLAFVWRNGWRLQVDSKQIPHVWSVVDMQRGSTDITWQ